MKIYFYGFNLHFAAEIKLFFHPDINIVTDMKDIQYYRSIHTKYDIFLSRETHLSKEDRASRSKSTNLTTPAHSRRTL